MEIQLLDNKKSIDKIIALWALSEAGLGGLFHAFNIPFTGLIIAGMAVLFISLIAFFSNKNYSHLLRATLVVLIIKMMISPHTPPTAYLAVFFQGLIGYALFRFVGFNRVSIYLLAILSLLESGFQKLFTMTLFYGFSIWDSINAFYHYIAEQIAFINNFTGSQVLLLLYFGIYLISALLFATLSVKTIWNLPSDSITLLKEFTHFLQTQKPDIQTKKKGNKLFGRRSWLFIILIFMLGILLIFKPEVGWQKAIYIFLRAVLVIVAWYTILAPLVKQILERYLKKQKKKYASELTTVLSLFPVLKKIVFFSLQKTGKIRSARALKDFFSRVIFLTLHAELEQHGTDNNINGIDPQWQNHSPEELD